MGDYLLSKTRHEAWKKERQRLLHDGLTEDEQDSLSLYAPTAVPSLTYAIQRRETTDTARRITLCQSSVVLQRLKELWEVTYNYEEISDDLIEVVLTEIAANKNLGETTALELLTCPFPGVHRALRNNSGVPNRVRALAVAQSC